MGTIMIPKKCKVGFQNREDTFTGKLAYVIYYDEKNVLRKENSWNSWRDEKQEPFDFENTPTSGFFVNKKVGGNRYGWDYRQAYCRIYDPRGFEIEITISNLIYILKNTNSSKDKGFEGEFVYGWDGKELLLVPVEAPEYQEIKAKTEAVYDKGYITAKNLVEGYTYANLDGKEYVYLTKDYKYTYDKVYENYKSWYNEYVTGYNIDGMTKQEYEKLPFSLEQPNQRILITKSNKKVYWFFDKDSNKVVIFNNLNKKLYYVKDENVAESILEYRSKLCENHQYSKIDYSKDKLNYYTLNEFIEKIIPSTKNSRYGWLALYDDSGKNWPLYRHETYFQIENVRGKKYLYTEKQHLEDVFNMIKPLKSNTHTLENGCLFEEVLQEYSYCYH